MIQEVLKSFVIENYVKYQIVTSFLTYTWDCQLRIEHTSFAYQTSKQFDSFSIHLGN